MPLNRPATAIPHPAPRLRPAHPTWRGGASSVLRLTQPAAQGRSDASALWGRSGRGAPLLMQVTGPLTPFRSRSRDDAPDATDG